MKNDLLNDIKTKNKPALQSPLKVNFADKNQESYHFGFLGEAD
jgi:hypothetical protein